PCRNAGFDPKAGTCTFSNLSGNSCSDACLSNAVCFDGRCVGVDRNCDDGLGCTVDACAADGACVPAASAQLGGDPGNVGLGPRCDAVSGCSTNPAADGVLCGPPDCPDSKRCLSGICQVDPKAPACVPPVRFEALVSSHDGNDVIRYAVDGGSLTW